MFKIPPFSPCNVANPWHCLTQLSLIVSQHCYEGEEGRNNAFPIIFVVDCRQESNCYSEFEKAFLTVLNKEAPLKTKFMRHRNNPFLSKELRRASTERSQLKNRWNKNGSYENWYLYKQQRNFCVSLLKKTKRN